MELPTAVSRISYQRTFMRSYFARMTPRTLMLLTVPALAAAYCLATVLLPAIVHAILPDAVRSVLSLI